MRSLLIRVSVSAALASLGCYSASSDDGGDGATGGTGSSGGSGGKAATGGTTGRGGSGGSSSGGSAGDLGGDAGESGSSGRGGSSAGSAGTGQAGSSASCIEDSFTLAVSGTTSSCGYPVPADYSADSVTVYFVLGGSQQPLCRHADSQGCALSGGYWLIGDEVALCDETCSMLDIEGGSFVAVRGCEPEYCTP